MKSLLLKFGLPALTLLTFFFLLGNRPLNEPDEGRYAEIAREMIETANWLVPHFWYVPHLDKPPLSYWLVAASMRTFGQNEWAVRLPVALAGISGVWATFLLGSALGGRRVGLWSALLLQSTALYWLMSRMLTTDIFLTQFIAWAIYFFWRSWIAADRSKGQCLGWHLVGWIFIALAFLTKGPVALAIPLVSFLALCIFRRGKVPGILYAGLVAGFALFLLIAAPWFLIIFQRVPGAAHYMILGQAAGHFLGTTVKDRKGIPGYFFGDLALGFLPWTLLLGWLWRREHWRSLNVQAREGWLLLNSWAIFTITLFSFSQAKLPAYILPLFPPLAVMVAWRFFGEAHAPEVVPRIYWKIGAAFCFLLPAIFPLAVYFLLHDKLPLWLDEQTPLVLITLGLVLAGSRNWKRERIAAYTVAMALLGFFATIGEFPLFEFNFKSNQPLDQMGRALRAHYQPGDAIVCWRELPQGLPFYAGGIISATNRPFFGYMPLDKVPFEFPGNRERFNSFYLDDQGLANLLQQNPRTLIVNFATGIPDFQAHYTNISLYALARSGKWTLYSNNPNDAPESSSLR